MSIQVIQIQPEFKQFTLYNPQSGLYKKKCMLLQTRSYEYNFGRYLVHSLL